MFKSSVGFATIEVGLKYEVVSDDVGDNAGLSNEAVEGEEVGVT